MSPGVIYTLWTTYPNHPLIVQKEILNVFFSAPKFPGKKSNGYMFNKIAHQLNNAIRNLEMVYKKGERISTHDLCLITSY